MRLGRLNIPNELRDRTSEILGAIKANTMPDCVYNELLINARQGAELSEDSVDLPAFLKDYQRRDLRKALARSAVFNINKPGYGKTLETIVWIKLTLKKDFKALVLCPKSVIDTWHAQLYKYWPTWCSDGTWWITNYEQLYDARRRELAYSFEWDVVVLDESHTIKSFKSKITDICMGLKARAKHCLTGTPIKNRPEDLAAQLKWLDPTSITSYTDFQYAFCHLIRDKWGVKAQGLTRNQKMVENLQRLLDLYCVGGEEHDIGAEKPEHIKVRLKLDKEVKALYNKLVGEKDPETGQRVIDTVYLLEKGIKVSNSIEAATRRQQLASNCQLFDANLHNVKFEWILDWVRGTDEKVLIFSKYAETIAALELFLKRHRVNVLTVRREQKTALRTSTIERWKRSGQVLLGTFGVLGTGTDGLQESCRYCIFVDRCWTASDNEQAEKRIYRTGQKRHVIFYILQAVGTIDVLIENLQHQKGLDASRLLEEVSDDLE